MAFPADQNLPVIGMEKNYRLATILMIE